MKLKDKKGISVIMCACNEIEGKNGVYLVISRPRLSSCICNRDKGQNRKQNQLLWGRQEKSGIFIRIDR